MKTPDWTEFRSAGTDPEGPCCLLERAFPVDELPRNYIWTIGYLGLWQGPEEAEINTQVKSYSRKFIEERAALLRQKREELEEKEARYREQKRAEIVRLEELTKTTSDNMSDQDAIRQRIEAGPLQMARSLAKAGADLATGGMTNPKERMNVCNKCPFKSDNGRCGKCGCVLAAKTRVKKSTCPIGLW